MGSSLVNVKFDEILCYSQDVTAAAMRACRDAISSNSIPAFRRGSIPGVTFEEMKLEIKLGVPHLLQPSLDVERNPLRRTMAGVSESSTSKLTRKFKLANDFKLL
ncbi:hypothetical protein Prudu_011089 [Prunus dulcis]|uniref:Uncharacterized protein n=1 Tax=Prunus dulcis TaxID=3755 RepID=A0A4Y1RAI8_PRUDU|nr:hypothetical protein Prudu_011089 [Prunus dulcis]